MTGLSKNFYGELFIKPRSLSNWIDYSPNLQSGSYSKTFDTASSLNLNIIDPDRILSTSFGIGYDVKLKLGFDDLPDKYLFNGLIGTNGIVETDFGFSLQCYDFINQLVTESIHITQPDAPIRNIYDHISYRKGYNGWECYNVIQDMVLSLRNSPLIMGGAGTNPLKKISADDGFYGLGSKKSFVDKALSLCTDTNISTNPYPLSYHYFQTNDSSASTFQFIKEKDVESSIAEYVFDDKMFMLEGNVLHNIDQYTSAKVKDTNIYYKNTSAVNTYGEKCLVLDKKYDSYDKNYQMAVDIVEKLRFPNKSFEVTVFDGLGIELGNIVEIQSDLKPSLVGKHQVNQISYDFSDTQVTTRLTLSNKLTKMIDILQFK